MSYRTLYAASALLAASLLVACSPSAPEVELPREWVDEGTGTGILLRPDGSGTVVDLPLGADGSECASEALVPFSGEVNWVGVGEFEYRIAINGVERSLWVDVERLGSANFEEVSFLPCDGDVDWGAAVTLYG